MGRWRWEGGKKEREKEDNPGCGSIKTLHVNHLEVTIFGTIAMTQFTSCSVMGVLRMSYLCLKNI